MNSDDEIGAKVEKYSDLAAANASLEHMFPK
jgi:hypothetical protein